MSQDLLLALATGLSLLYVLLLLRKIRRLKNQTSLTHDALFDLESFVFDNAKFPDKKGRSDANYNSKEVEESWTKFHDLSWKVQDHFLRLRNIFVDVYDKNLDEDVA